jgi:hypothetical protein
VGPFDPAKLDIHPSVHGKPRAEAGRLARGVMKVIDVEVRSRLGELYWYNKRRTLQSV